MMMWQKIKNKYHFLIAVLANIVYFFPSRKMNVIAVTGTDGKTTTVNLIYHILKTAGYKVSMVTSIGAVVNGINYDIGFHVTTPTAFPLQRFLRKAKNAKSSYFVLEVTSHAIDQKRIAGIPFKVGVLTNVTNEHLDYHKTYDNYLKTKIGMLKKAEICVVNSDDSSYTLLSEVKNIIPQDKWITYGLTDSSDYNPKTFDISSAKLLGDFNKYNVLAAVAVSRALGIKGEVVEKALKTFHMPIGRADFVYEDGFRAMIDFAHTPNAFEQILGAVRPIVKGRIIHVFGSAGGRDALKRPFLGEISSQYCNILVLTAEDPRKEDVNTIIAEIETGVKKEQCEVIRIPDRTEAIGAAIEMAKDGDLVLITGKAHEKSMNLGNGEIPWDEYKTVENALKLRNKE